MTFQTSATDNLPGQGEITKVYITDAEKNILFQTPPESTGMYAVMKQAVEWMVENDRFYDFSFGRVITQTFSNGRPEVITGYYPWIKCYDTGIRYQEDYADRTKIAIITRSRSFVSPVSTVIRETNDVSANTVAVSYPTCQIGLRENIKTGTAIGLSSFSMGRNLISQWTKPTT